MLSNYNPGRLKFPFLLSTAGPPKRYVTEMANLDGQDDEDDQIGLDLVERTWWLRQEWQFPEHLLFLAGGHHEEHYVVSSDEADVGRVYAVWYSEAFEYEDDDHVELQAESVGEFLARLEPRPYPLSDSN